MATLLAGSLLVNAAGAAYLAYRATRSAPAAIDHRAERLGLFRELAGHRARIVMFGDSLTERGEWSELLRIEGVANRGIAGETIGGALERVHEVIEARPEAVAVMLGINDLFADRSPDDCAADLERLVRRLRAGLPEARIILQSVLPVGPTLDRYTVAIRRLDDRLRAVCGATTCDYLDVGALRPALAGDGVHLTGTGYGVWAKALRSQLELPE